MRGFLEHKHLRRLDFYVLPTAVREEKQFLLNYLCDSTDSTLAQSAILV